MAQRKTGTKETKPNRTAPPARTRTAPPQSRGDLRKIGALWISHGKNGKFLSGRIQLSETEEIRVLVFPNGYKEETKHPDYVIYEPGEPQAESKGYRATDDDIPF